MTIHLSALVDPKARLGEGVEIGPYCIVGPDVTLHAGVRLLHHVVVAPCPPSPALAARPSTWRIRASPPG